MKTLLRDIHLAVWRRVRLADSLSIAELHRVIQLLMGWDDDHPHRFASMAGDCGLSRFERTEGRRVSAYQFG